MSSGQHGTLGRGEHRTVRPVTRTRSRVLKGLVAVPFLFALATGAAWAYWSAGSVPGGNGASAVTSLNPGATPVASAGGGSVTVSWAASTFSDGSAVHGYELRRYDLATLTAQTMLSCGDDQMHLTRTCTETNVPPGQWVYTVQAWFGWYWNSAEGPTSNAVTVNETTPPANAISLSGVSGNAVKSGNTIFYRGAALGSFTLTNAVTDSGSGPASSATATLTGTTTGWTHSPSTVSAPAGGPYLSTAFSWTAGTTSSPTEIVTSRDVANNAAATTLTFVNDSTGPTGGSVAASGLVGTGTLYAISATLSLNLAKGTDPSGLAVTGAFLQRAAAPLMSDGTANGTCGTYGTYTLVTGGNDPATPKSDLVADAACWKYQYVVADTLGNSTTYTSADIKVDLTAPTPAPSLTFGAFNNTYWTAGPTVYYRGAAASGSFTATASATDPRSGIFSYAFPALGTNWTSTPGSLGVNTYSWTTGPAAPGPKSVTATNNATGTSAATSFTPTADNTAPSAGTVSYFNGTQSGTTVSVSFTTGTDAASGLGTKLLQRASATLTGTTCGTYTGFSTVTNGTNPTSPLLDTVSLGKCYKYQYLVSDNVGNQHTATSASIVKVTTASCATPGDQPALIASADVQVKQGEPNLNFGTETVLRARSSLNNNRRSLLRFTLPTLPAGCTVTASTLRLYNSLPTSGRVISVYQAAATWNEGVATWNNQPGQAGTAVTSTAGATGWQTWTVTTHVIAQYTTNNGFVLRDQTEDAGTQQQQEYHSREFATVSLRPELIVTLG